MIPDPKIEYHKRILNPIVFTLVVILLSTKVMVQIGHAIDALFEKLVFRLFQKPVYDSPWVDGFKRSYSEEAVHITDDLFWAFVNPVFSAIVFNDGPLYKWIREWFVSSRGM